MYINITKIYEALSNLRQGDMVFLDIDQTILWPGIEKYLDKPTLKETRLPELIKQLQQSNIKVIGLTARKEERAETTKTQLELFDIKLDEIIYAPSYIDDAHVKHMRKGNKLKSYLKECPTIPKRIIVIDDNKEQLDAINEVVNELPKVLYHYQFPNYYQLPRYEETCEYLDKLPESMDGYTEIQPLGGGTQSVFKLTNPKNNHAVVIKLSIHHDSFLAELLSFIAYSGLGVNVPDFRLFNRLPKTLAKGLSQQSGQSINPHGLFLISEYIEADQNQDEKIINAQVLRDYVAHALIGNIDIKPENFILDKNNRVYLLDAGANFLFRSLGGIRKENPHFAREIESFIRKGKFDKDDIDDEAISKQLYAISPRMQHVYNLLDEVISNTGMANDITYDYTNALANRYNDLLAKLLPDEATAQQDKLAVAGATAAGILTFTYIDGEAHVLLGKRVRHKFWDNFGGKSDPEDNTLITTAIREVYEESSGVLHYYQYELEDYPFHDLHFNRNGKPYTYRMYIAEHVYIDPEQLIDKEHTAYQWLPVTQIIQALQIKKEEVIEQKYTINIGCNENEVYLLPEFYQMLLQAPVIQHLRHLQDKKPLHKQCTQSKRANYNPNMGVSSIPVVLNQAEKKKAIIKQLSHHFKLTESINCRKEGSGSNSDLLEISQSELHLNTLLSSEQIKLPLEDKIKIVIDKYFNHLVDDEKKKKRLTDISTALIKEEKENPDYLYFYHGSNNIIGFVYHINTLIYKALSGRAQQTIFRLNALLIKKFSDVTHFMESYSKNGRIHNYDKGYMDVALSTNLFVFGNHQNDTSCSIQYMTKNGVRKQLSLKTIFDDYFYEFNIDKKILTKLIALYETYFKAAGGMLYQIKIHKNTVPNIAYAAGGFGMANPYRDTLEPVAVLDMLRKEKELQGRDVDYIQSLQARLMAIPDKMEQVITYPWQKDTDIIYSNQANNLQRIANEIANTILNHFEKDTSDMVHDNAFLTISQQLLTAHNINLSLSPERSLIKAMAEKDTATVINIVAKHLGLLDKKLTGKRYNIKNISVLEYLEEQGVNLKPYFEKIKNRITNMQQLFNVYNMLSSNENKKSLVTLFNPIEDFDTIVSNDSKELLEIYVDSPKFIDIIDYLLEKHIFPENIGDKTKAKLNEEIIQKMLNVFSDDEFKIHWLNGNLITDSELTPHLCSTILEKALQHEYKDFEIKKHLIYLSTMLTMVDYNDTDLSSLIDKIREKNHKIEYNELFHILFEELKYNGKIMFFRIVSVENIQELFDTMSFYSFSLIWDERTLYNKYIASEIKLAIIKEHIKRFPADYQLDALLKTRKILKADNQNVQEELLKHIDNFILKTACEKAHLISLEAYFKDDLDISDEVLFDLFEVCEDMSPDPTGYVFFKFLINTDRYGEVLNKHGLTIIELMLQAGVKIEKDDDCVVINGIGLASTTPKIESINDQILSFAKNIVSLSDKDAAREKLKSIPNVLLKLYQWDLGDIAEQLLYSVDLKLVGIIELENSYRLINPFLKYYAKGKEYGKILDFLTTIPPKCSLGYGFDDDLMAQLIKDKQTKIIIHLLEHYRPDNGSEVVLNLLPLAIQEKQCDVIAPLTNNMFEYRYLYKDESLMEKKILAALELAKQNNDDHSILLLTRFRTKLYCFNRNYFEPDNCLTHFSLFNHTVNFGYPQKEKTKAADALLSVIDSRLENDQQPDSYAKLEPHLGALQNGRLGKIVKDIPKSVGQKYGIK